MKQEESSIIMERNASATMRDGTILMADIYRPEKDGKFPVLLERIPYSKGFMPFASLSLDPLAAAHAGYVVIIQDVRGRFESEGDTFYIYKNEFEDGYDSVEWAASLPYSDGNVGMFGVSYMGMTQWQAAVEQPPHLKAIFPVTWGTDAYMYRGGALELGLIGAWTLGSIGPNAVLRAKNNQPDMLQDFLSLINTTDNIEENAYKSLPLKDAPWLKLGNGFAPFYRELIERVEYDEFHQNISVRTKPDKVKVPAFCIAGWYDLLLEQNLDHFQRIRKEGANEIVRKQSRLMIGPWAHASFAGAVGELNFGTAASGLLLELKRDLTTLQLQWFDYWLKGIDNGITEEAPVKIFVMGDNKWRDEQEWPLARTQYTSYYFRSEGKANTRFGNGWLSTEPPGDESPDHFVFDPHNPVPTHGGNTLMPSHYIRGPLDQSLLEEREDVLVYTSEQLEKDVEVTGYVKVTLFAASSAPDTDFTVKLVDVHPNGKAFNITDGIIRARYRDGVSSPSLIEPNKVYEYTIDLLPTSSVFKVGHKIRVEISSSNFPRFDRNPNTGELSKDSSELKQAKQTILHNEQYPSQIILPIIPR